MSTSKRVKSSKKSKKSTSTSGDSPSVGTLAEKAASNIQTISNSLPLDDALSPQDLKVARGATRVPNAAILLAAQVVESDPTRFPDFDADDARDAVTYEQALGPIGQDAQALATRIQKSIMKKRGGAAGQTLAMYAILKGLARVPTNETSRAHLKQMKTILATRTSKRALKVTGAETQTFVKAAKAVKLANQNIATAADAANKASSSVGVAANQAATASSLLQTAPIASPAPAAQPAVATPAAPPAGTPGH